MTAGYGIDMGTQNLRIFSRQTGEIIQEKNTIAIVSGNQMYAYGDEAYSMYEKAPETIEVSFPINGGVIADFDNMQTMILEALEGKVKARLKGADIVIAVPTDITEVEKKAFFDMFAKTKIKARSVKLCEKPIADAIGMGIDVSEPTGVMVVDLGADTTEISVVSLGGLVLSELLPLAGNRLDESIATYIKRHNNLLIGLKTAKSLKESLGSALPPAENAAQVVVGRDVVSGLPIEMQVTADMVYEGIKDDLASIGAAIRMILEKVPPELAKDIVREGIFLTGGSSKIRGIADYFSSLTNIRMKTAERGEETVVLGLGQVLTDDRFERYGYTMRSRIFS